MEGKEEEEIKLGAEETIRTIDRIRYLNSIEDDICSVLKTHMALYYEIVLGTA